MRSGWGGGMRWVMAGRKADFSTSLRVGYDFFVKTLVADLGEETLPVFLIAAVGLF